MAMDAIRLRRLVAAECFRPGAPAAEVEWLWAELERAAASQVPDPAAVRRHLDHEPPENAEDSRSWVAMELERVAK